MAVYQNKIEAIKAMRTMFASMGKVRFTNEHSVVGAGGERVTMTVQAELGLKESKDFVEECMALGVAQHIRPKGDVVTVVFSRENVMGVRSFYNTHDAIDFSRTQHNAILIYSTIE
jgi:hypothetical protein